MVEAHNPTAYEENPKLLRNLKAKFLCFFKLFSRQYNTINDFIFIAFTATCFGR